MSGWIERSGSFLQEGEAPCKQTAPSVFESAASVGDLAAHIHANVQLRVTRPQPGPCQLVIASTFACSGMARATRAKERQGDHLVKRCLTVHRLTMLRHANNAHCLRYIDLFP